jgi:hypothetical protein
MSIMVNSKVDIFQEMEFINLKILLFMKGNSKKIIFKERESLSILLITLLSSEILWKAKLTANAR